MPMFLAAGAAGVALVVGLHPSRSALTTSAVGQPGRHAGRPSPSTTGTAVPSTTSPPAQSTSGKRSADGTGVNYGYGTLSVRVTAQGHRIVDVAVPSLQTVDPTSQSIAQQVIPTLRQQVLNAQSANIQGVSGATYTSMAFARSLQSALTRLGHP
jgi:uncharacterized protein with FMN-binding domain